MPGHSLQVVDRNYVLFEGRRLLFFAGTDYHRLSTHPAVAEAAAKAARQFGISPGGSRTTTADHPLYAKLEEKLAGFFGREAALLLPSGYLAAMALLQGIAADFDVLFLDEQAHSSLKDAAAISGMRQHVFRHLDSENLQDLIKKNLRGREKPLLLTDGVFPARGEIAPLAEYSGMMKSAGGAILADDAHAMAVTGPTGKGSPETAGVNRELLFQTGTLSKGFGVFGGVITGQRALIERIRRNSAVFSGSSGLPLPAAAAALQAVSILQENPRLISGLQQTAFAFTEKLVKLGLFSQAARVPIVSITWPDQQTNTDFYRALLEAGIYPSYNNYPGSPQGGHFRFVLSSQHSKTHLDLLHGVIEMFCKKGR
ncbi:MAG: aminotransferase class I/II-fold pyridoxal phosphate-dependent enzyme [Calditrichia bacterium]